eukprot:1764175-Pyramimonas_sp.AAC.2
MRFRARRRAECVVTPDLPPALCLREVRDATPSTLVYCCVGRVDVFTTECIDVVMSCFLPAAAAREHAALQRPRGGEALRQRG